MNQELMQKALCGDPEAQYIIGDAYYNGTGVAQSYEEAYQWYSCSAEQGNAWGQFNMGKCYLYGHGVEMCAWRAKLWFGCCAAQNNEWGQKYSYFCNNYEEIMTNAMAGDAESQYQYGKAFYEGREVGPSYENALIWYLKAAEQGHKQGQFEAGRCILLHGGGQFSCYNALPFFQSSASQGNEMANGYILFCKEQIHHDDTNYEAWWSLSDNLLHMASRIGDIELLEFVLKCGVKIDYRSNCMEPTALHICCSHGFANCVSFLLQHGADIESCCGSRDTPIHDAAMNGHTDCVRILLEHGANVNSETSNYDTPLELALLHNHQACAQLLIDFGGVRRKSFIKRLSSDIHRILKHGF